METIGFDFIEMETYMISMKQEMLKKQEETIQSNTAQFISEGCTEDEARFRAGIIGAISIDATIILGIIYANNKRILLDLKKTGLLNS